MIKFNMPKRSKKRQTAHNRKIDALAREHKREGWSVKADIPGFKRPTPIGRYQRIPDLELKKRGRTKLIEVETPSTLISDKKQQETFRRSSSLRKNTSFKVVIVKPRKSKKK